MITKYFFKIFKSLPHEIKNKSVIFVFFLIFTTILEIFGISLIVPILDLLSNTETNPDQRTISFFKYFGLENLENILIYILFLFVGVYTFKNIFLIFLL